MKELRTSGGFIEFWCSCKKKTCRECSYEFLESSPIKIALLIVIDVV